MKDFKEVNELDSQIFEAHEVAHLSDEERKIAENMYVELVKYFNENNTATIDEGLFGSIIGGVAGFIVGPALGKAVAHALGIERGILYDMLTSRLVSTALGAAIGK